MLSALCVLPRDHGRSGRVAFLVELFQKRQRLHVFVMIINSFGPRQDHELSWNDGFNRFTEGFSDDFDVRLLSLFLLIMEILVEVLMNRRSVQKATIIYF